MNKTHKPACNVTKNPYFYVQDDSLVITHSSGFFSNCSVALYAISLYYNFCQKLPNNVDFSQSFKSFSNSDSGDVYSKYFAYQDDMKVSYDGNIQMNLMSLFNYQEEQYNKLTPLIQKYFTPSNEVQLISDQLTKKYNIDFSNTLAICYRGTDKYLETPAGMYSEYIERAREILKLEPNLNILVQTDQKQFLDYCKQELDSVFNFDEMPVTDTKSPMHDIVDPKDKIEWTRTLVAVTNLLSKCKYIVNHSGNVARWICLYREGTSGVVQHHNPDNVPQGTHGDSWYQ